MYKKHWTVMLVIVCAMIALSGCQTGKSVLKTQNQGLQLSEAVLPTYMVGEYFNFDDGSSRMVAAVSGEWVTWQYNTGTVSKGYRNFIIPALTWTSAHRYSEGKTTAPADLLWPLAVGKKGTYDFQQTISKHDGTESNELSRSWSCAVEGTERVSVPAGTFDTYVIACNRYSSTSHKWRASRKLYYAPDLGHYVMKQDRHRSRPDKKRQLVSYGFRSIVLPEKDQIKLNRTLQKALSNNADGIASTWTSSTGEVTAMLIPISSYKVTNGEACREYHSVYNVRGRIRKNVRVVCKQSNGLWYRVK
jgi:hypothetical protein